jgi:hypothetical protein
MALPMKTTAMKSSPMKKAMKSKRVSKIAKGRLARAQVFRGSKERTSGGLKRDGIQKNTRGKIVSKKSSAVHKKLYHGSKFEAWVKAVAAARKSLGVVGFCALNGKTAQGKAFYAKAKSIYAA